MAKSRTATLHTSHLPKPEQFNIYANPLDQQALDLCRRVTSNVRLYKGSPFIVGTQRLSLHGHYVSLEKLFLNQASVKTVIADPKNASPGHVNFVQNTLAKLPRHDMGEMIREPQTFLQKIDPTLKKWKPDLKAYETRIVQTQYHMAQRFAAANRGEEFIAIVTDLQDGMADFDDIASSLQGVEYRDYIERSFDGVLMKFETRCSQSGLLLSSDIMEQITDNDFYHWKHYRETEAPEVRIDNPEGLQTKLIDKNDDYYIKQGRLKLNNPKAKGLKIEREGSAIFISTVARAEEYLQPFLKACDNDPRQDLGVFKENAHKLVYSHLVDYTLLGQPVIQFCPDHQMFEPTPKDSQNDFDDYQARQKIILAERRRNVDPLEDKQMQSNHEIAARALTVCQSGDLTTTRLFNPKRDYSTDFVEKFKKNLKIIRNDPLPVGVQAKLFS